jgi:aminomethyltransferase
MKTALYDRHVSLGARMAPFGGWDMPIQYEGILAEHEHTRRAASVFDICHMGEFELSGPTATQDLERLLTMPVRSIAVGQCKYGFLLNDKGGVIDDLTCYRMDEQHYMLVVNAATCAGDAAWIQKHLSPTTNFHDISSWTGKLDVQGPQSRKLLEDAIEMPVPDLKYFHFTRINLLGCSCLISRTGYTGEWGYELYLPIQATGALWDLLLSKGEIKPAGLGARDTLRLEVGYPLYGHELCDTRTPVEAFGKNFIDQSKNFIGHEAVRSALENSPAQKLVGLQLEGKRAARAGDRLMANGEAVGEITSGSFAPSLGYAVAAGYLRQALASEGQELEIEVKATRLKARVVSLPFYKNGTARKNPVVTSQG